MKTCPICHARCFDDMEVCYGCMHRFDDDAPESKSPADFELPFIDVAQMGERPAKPPEVKIPQVQPQFRAPRHAAQNAGRPSMAVNGNDADGGGEILRIPIAGQTASALAAAGYQLVISLQPIPLS